VLSGAPDEHGPEDICEEVGDTGGSVGGGEGRGCRNSRDPEYEGADREDGGIMCLLRYFRQAIDCICAI
jgi:hypothetical protein